MPKLHVLISFSHPFSFFSLPLAFLHQVVPKLEKAGSVRQAAFPTRKLIFTVKPVSKAEIFQFAGALPAADPTQEDAHDLQLIVHVLREGAGAQEHLGPQDTTQLQTNFTLATSLQRIPSLTL